MIAGVVDTTVIFHLFRKNPAALAWYSALTSRLAVTPITWMEALYGAASKDKQERCTAILSQFDMEYVLPGDMDWAIQAMQTKRLSQGIAVNDCFIASVCTRLNVPVYTDNQRDFLKVLPPQLVIKPY
jgi:predicted nucleic acid-binding protein